MQEKISKIGFDTLPENVKIAVWEILAHRIGISGNAWRFFNLSAIPTALLVAGYLSKEMSSKYFILDFSASAVTGLTLLHKHKKKYVEEELDLFRKLRDSNNKKIKELISSWPYIVVDLHGNLVGKKRNPKILFIPIGRRRIPTKDGPTRTNKKRKLWEKMMRKRK